MTARPKIYLSCPLTREDKLNMSLAVADEVLKQIEKYVGEVQPKPGSRLVVSFEFHFK